MYMHRRENTPPSPYSKYMYHKILAFLTKSWTVTFLGNILGEKEGIPPTEGNYHPYIMVSSSVKTSTKEHLWKIDCTKIQYAELANKTR